MDELSEDRIINREAGNDSYSAYLARRRSVAKFGK